MASKYHLRRKRTLLHWAGIAVAVLLSIIVIWVDIATGLWQDTVVLSGIAAGLLTFVLTAVFLDRWMIRGDHNRWLPVTSLALTDVLHTLADDEASELSRGTVVPRRLSLPAEIRREDADALLHAVIVERREISHMLSRWSGFLAASADVRPLMVHIADTAACLDQVRDGALEYETAAPESEAEARRALTGAVDEYNRVLAGAVSELEALLGRVARSVAT